MILASVVTQFVNITIHSACKVNQLFTQELLVIFSSSYPAVKINPSNLNNYTVHTFDFSFSEGGRWIDVGISGTGTGSGTSCFLEGGLCIV